MKQIVLTFACFLILCTSAWSMSVTLGWDANTEVDLAGYNIYYGYSAGVTKTSGTKINMPLSAITPSNPQFTITGLPDDKKVYFVVTAYDNETPSLESGESNEVFAYVGMGTPPKNPILRLIKWLLSLFGGLYVDSVG